MKLTLLCCPLSFGLFVLATARTPNPIVKTSDITYIGATNTNLKLDYFSGVPYAKPPTGSLRFKPPQPWSPSKDTRVVNATAYRDSCPQGVDQGLAAESEDCLTLSIWKPSNITGILPVMIWLYGGGFYVGSADLYPGDGIVNASIMMNKPVIYVVPNYRAGIFGFPPGQAAAKSGALNLGLKDQRKALEWVQKNIRYFGGDPKKVTLFGQSSGAISAGFQALYNRGEIGGAFRGMILQSGSPSSVYVPPANDPALERVYQFVVNATGCANASNTFECIRSAPYDTLYRANRDVVQNPPGAIIIGPTIAPGEAFLPELPSVSVHAGRFAKVPFLAGSQLDEGTLFVDGQLPQTENDLINWLTGETPGGYVGITNVAATKELLKFYSTEPAAGSPYGTGNQTFGLAAQYKRLASVVGDLVFEASRRDLTRTAIRFGVKAWSYVFAEVVDPIGKEQYGVYHGGDIPFVFQQVHTTPGASQSLLELEQTVADYWLSFVHNLDPNRGSFTSKRYWPYHGTNSTMLRLASNITVISDTFRKSATDFIISSPSLYN